MLRNGRTTLALLLSCALGAATAGADTFSVETLAFSDVNDTFCSLPEAVKAVNGGAEPDCPVVVAGGTDTIQFAVAGTIFYNGALDELGESTIVDAAGITFDGDDQFHRLLSIDSALVGQTLTVKGAVLQNSGDSAIWIGPGESLVLEDARVQDSEAALGGAVYAAGAVSVRIVRSQLSRNEAHQGGAVYLTGASLVVEDSTFSHNVAAFPFAGGQGGAIYAAQTSYEIRRSTFAANTAKDQGGALALYLDTTGTIMSSTIANNTADSDANGWGDGGGIWLSLGSSATLKNTIVAGNNDSAANGGTVVPDVFLEPDGSTISGLLGFNLIGSNASVEVPFPVAALPDQPNVNGNYVGIPGARIAPALGALDANGGPTDTRMPLPGSLVIDKGMCLFAPHDQRGFGNPNTIERAYDVPAIANGLNSPDACDIGAVEYLAVP